MKFNLFQKSIYFRKSFRLTRIAQDIFVKLEKNGYISKDGLEQLQCQQCLRSADLSTCVISQYKIL